MSLQRTPTGDGRSEPAMISHRRRQSDRKDVGIIAQSRCPVCTAEFRRVHSPPVTLLPCGHLVCRPCMDVQSKNSVIQSCMICRKRLQGQELNESLLDIIEQTHVNRRLRSSKPRLSRQERIGSNIDDNDIEFENPVYELYSNTRKRTDFEVVTDRCETAWYILDNSGSMDLLDGKVFLEEANGTVVRRDYVSRFAELISKVEAIAQYNIRRKVKSAYYLLNPESDNRWRENLDFVIIDPRRSDRTQRLDHLLGRILSPSNIRGSTPLHTATEYFESHLKSFIGTEDAHVTPICFNILTDGEPDAKHFFELALTRLVSRYHVFVCVNLCTEQDSVLDYYNELDQKLGSEMSGMDVIDDMVAESQEISHVGNNFFVYSYDFHVCRMAGCYSIVSDLLDEEVLPPHHLALLCKELTRSAMAKKNRRSSSSYTDFEEIPHWSEPGFIEYLNTHDSKVYNISTQRFEPLIITSRVKNAIRYNNMCKLANKFKKSRKAVVIAVFLISLLVYTLTSLKVI